MEARMSTILKRAREEPALLVALALAVINLVVGGEQAEHLQRVIESIAVLAGGFVVRSQVTPVSKLPESRRG